MTTDALIDWVEMEWSKTKPEIKNDEQRTLKGILTDSSYTKQSRQLRSAIERIPTSSFAGSAEPHIKRTNAQYQKILEKEIDSINTIDELNKVKIDEEFEIASRRARKTLDARRRFLETEQISKEIKIKKRKEEKEDEIKRYMARGFTREQAEDIAR